MQRRFPTSCLGILGPSWSCYRRPLPRRGAFGTLPFDKLHQPISRFIISSSGGFYKTRWAGYIGQCAMWVYNFGASRFRIWDFLNCFLAMMSIFFVIFGLNDSYFYVHFFPNFFQIFLELRRGWERFLGALIFFKIIYFTQTTMRNSFFVYFVPRCSKTEL